ncbi:MAG: glycosyltransferase family 39 protein [Bulleidia sp.]|nr:glycosyltransferase family 39 protein [Bulleidia sp.]
MKEQTYRTLKEHWLPVTLAFGLSIAFILLFSHSTSPLSWYYNGTDSCINVTIARGWYFDIIPYKDLFAENGPWMYWLGSIGTKFVYGNKGGIIIPQIINLFFFLLSVYFISRLATRNRAYTCMTLFLTICMLKTNYPDGMHAEEFLLPWIGWTYYLILYSHKKKVFPSFYSIFYGISIGVTVLCEPTGLLAYVPLMCLFAYMLIKKQWKDFFLSISCILIGFLCITMPFVLYFKYQNCLSEMIYDAYKYHTDLTFSATKTSYYYRLVFFLRFTAIALIFSAILFLCKKEYFKAISWGICGCIETYYFAQMNFTTYISMFCIVNLVFLCNSIYSLLPLQSHPKITMILCGCVSFTSMYYLYLKDYPNAIYTASNYSIYIDQGYEGLMKLIPSEDYDKLIFYGGKNMEDTYLSTNAMPCYKYFYLQDELSTNDVVLKEKIYSTFKTCKAKWILTDTHTDGIADILKQNYSLVDEAGIYSLYQRK